MDIEDQDKALFQSMSNHPTSLHFEGDDVVIRETIGKKRTTQKANETKHIWHNIRTYKDCSS